MFDNCLELLVMGGRSLPHAMMMMIPEPWENHESMSDGEEGVLRISFLPDGAVGRPGVDRVHRRDHDRRVLDRNGLRPSRYYVTKDDLVIMASEAGVLPVEPERVAIKGRLQPGRMFLVDMEQGRIVADEEIKNRFAAEHPYREWLDETCAARELPEPAHRHRAGLTRPCSSGSRRSVTRSRNCGSSWGRWRATACSRSARWARTRRWRCSPTSRSCFTIISSNCSRRSPIRRSTRIREEIITSTETIVGARGNLLNPTPESCRMIEAEASDPHQRGTGEAPARRPPRIQVGDDPDFVPRRTARRDWNGRWKNYLPQPTQAIADGVEHHHPLRPRRGHAERADSRAAGRCRACIIT